MSPNTSRGRGESGRKKIPQGLVTSERDICTMGARATVINVSESQQVSLSKPTITDSVNFREQREHISTRDDLGLYQERLM